MDIVSTVAAKIERGERLSDADALALFESSDLLGIGRLADAVNRKKNADVVFYNVNRHINPTNICALSCKFCAYSRKPGEEGGYAYSIDEILQKADEAVAQGATEVHMVGGLHPRWRFDYYKDMIKAVKDKFPDLHIKAFTAVELDWLARKARKTVAEVLEELRAVGLGSLPGGGAEIFHPEIRDYICDTKVPAEAWIDTHRTAHKLGMHSNCTMLYGHIETYAHRVDHMRRLRELQDETRGFNAFIPLSFQPFQNEMGIDKYTFGYDDLKTIAVARLYLDNFKHVKAYWIMLGQDVAQLALQFGANDLDGTVIEEKISRMAGGRAGMEMSRAFIESVVLKAKRKPVERDTLYNALPPREPQRQGASAAASAAPAVDTRTVLNRAAYGDELTLAELTALATAAPLHELGHAASLRAEKAAAGGEGSCAPAVVVPFATVAAQGSVGEAVRLAGERLARCLERHTLTPTSIAIDLGAASGGPHDIGLLLELAWALKHSFAGCDLSIWGVKALWAMAQAENADVGAIFERLREAGVEGVASSPSESERDLTPGEVTHLHRQLHAVGVPTVAKAELDAPAQGPGEPLWESFLRRIMALAALHAETGRLHGISVEVSQGSFVSATEYMRAVALARIAATGVPHVVTPLAQIPTISPARGIGTAISQHPAEKIAALCLHYGASDLGPIDVEALSPVDVLRQIRSAGFEPVLRDAASGARHEGPLPAQLAATRHVPAALPAH